VWSIDGRKESCAPEGCGKLSRGYPPRRSDTQGHGSPWRSAVVGGFDTQVLYETNPCVVKDMVASVHLVRGEGDGDGDGDVRSAGFNGGKGDERVGLGKAERGRGVVERRSCEDESRDSDVGEELDGEAWGDEDGCEEMIEGKEDELGEEEEEEEEEGDDDAAEVDWPQVYTGMEDNDNPKGLDNGTSYQFNK